MEQPNRKILALASMILLAVLLSGCGLPWPSWVGSIPTRLCH